jgi:hypothetical protein
MQMTIAVAAAVSGRPGDVLHVFVVGVPAGTKVARNPGGHEAPRSPFVWNATARAWFLTDSQAIGDLSRRAGSVRSYSDAPRADLAVERVITGSLVMTAQVSDMTYGRVDTMVTLEVTDDRPVAPGQHWYPRAASPHRM